MTGKHWLAILLVTAVVAGLGYAGLRVYRDSQSESCYACQRPVHAHMRTVAISHGKPRVFCCPACALAEREQEGKPIRIIELTDFQTGAKLSPAVAFVVKGSDVNMCARTHELMDADKRAADVAYDRCAPSLLAFGNQSDAVHFTRAHGGEVLKFTAVVGALSR